VLTLVAFIVLVALIFDFINGFHDAATPSPPSSPPGC
jgi:phosphate/sulfate permease